MYGCERLPPLKRTDPPFPHNLNDTCLSEIRHENI